MLKEFIRARAFACATFCIAALLHAAPALADACPAASGFNDILQSATYCSNAQWLKNRKVTLGCGDGSNFCPDQTITRAQMALFMNRLGTALTPLVKHQGGGADDLAVTPTTGATICYPPSAIAAADYPRIATYAGAVWGSAPSVAMTLKAAAVGSLNSGGAVPASSYAEARLATSPDATVIPAFGSFDIPAGNTFSFGIFVYTAAGTGTVDVACDLVVTIDNVNGTSPPY